MGWGSRVVASATVVGLVVALGPSLRLGGQTTTPPILVVLNNTTSNPLGNYYAEILRTEGVQSFATTTLANVTSGATVLGNYRYGHLPGQFVGPADRHGGGRR